VPAGAAGEIYVGGAGVARGYLNRPELTAQRFLQDPFAPAAGGRLYRSGDLGRYLPDGDLEYLGRIDQQVKIRGFRIELGEIAAELNRQPGILESVVIVTEPKPGEKALAAYFVKRDDGDTDLAAIRRELRVRLPEYMVPATFTAIPRLPLTVNGKLDVKALPPPDHRVRPAAAALGSGTPLERGIAGIWADVLQIPEPDLDQNFFDVGGNSLHVAQVHVRLQKFLDRTFSITELFAHSTIRALAAHFSSGSRIGAATASRTRAQRQRETVLAHRNVRIERK
jgi:acyl carrier protein